MGFQQDMHMWGNRDKGGERYLVFKNMIQKKERLQMKWQQMYLTSYTEFGTQNMQDGGTDQGTQIEDVQIVSQGEQQQDQQEQDAQGISGHEIQVALQDWIEC